MLAILILLPVFPIISNYIFYTRPLSEFPATLFAAQILFSFFGPVYFFYSLKMLGVPFTFSKTKVLHLLPACCILILWMVYALSGNEKQQEFMNSFNREGRSTWQLEIASIGPIMLVFGYVAAAARKVFHHTTALKEVFTSIGSLKIDYIREFTLLMILQIIILGVISVFTPALYVDLVWVPIFGNLFYFYIVYKSYNYGMIFSEKEYQDFQNYFNPLNRYLEENKEKKYAASELPNSKLEEYAACLTEGFQNEQWYLDPELNLSSLSEKAGIPAHSISQVINRRFKKNFFDFVNSYRVEELKVKLIDEKFTHIKLEELAYTCGFNSKAAYQRAFKKHTGMTPTAYRALESPVSLKAV